MKRFLVFLVISGILGFVTTFVFFAERPLPPDPIREQYTDVFKRFGLHAEKVYHQFDDASGLDILAHYDAEGLRLLLQYEDLIAQLYPHIDTDSLMSLCRTDGDSLAALLTIFHPGAVADMYSRYGLNGLRYVLDDPHRYFLLHTHGTSLVQLADIKGPIIFDLVQTYSPEFLEIYYDDALFNAIQHFGLDGLLAIQTYRGMATTLFTLFREDTHFAHALRAYGYQQVIPVLYYVYQQQTPLSLQEQVTNLEPVDQLQKPTDSLSEYRFSTETTEAQTQQERVRQALQQINTRGNTFLRQFSIASDGTVTPLPVVSFVNFLEDVLLGEVQYAKPSFLVPEQDNAEPLACDQLYAVLDLLSLLPQGTLPAKQTRCAYLRSSIAAATSREAVAGLLALDTDQSLVEQYGPEVVPFVTHYGQAGIDLIRQTEGAILAFAETYGPDLVEYAISYGPDLPTLVDEFDGPLIEAIHNTHGEIIPHVRTHGQDALRFLAHPEGPALLGFTQVFGDSIIDYTLQYPNVFPRALYKYGRTTLTAITRYHDEIVDLARRNGDDALFYAGRYDEHVLRLLKLGSAGTTLLRVLPDTKLQDSKFLSRSFPSLMFNLLMTSPRTVHAYIGALGHAYVSFDPRYLQMAFWMLLSLCILSGLGLLYSFVKRLFWV